MNGEVGINGETGKNTAIRNFIELKSSNNLVIYQQKEHKKYQGSFSIWSANLTLYILINIMLIKKNMYIKQFCGFT